MLGEMAAGFGEAGQAHSRENKACLQKGQSMLTKGTHSQIQVMVSK